MHANHVWAIDFVHDKLSNGRSYKMLTVLDEFTRQALCVEVQDKMNSDDVLQVIHQLLMKHRESPNLFGQTTAASSLPNTFRNGSERLAITPIQIYPGSPWENGYNERFNGILRQEVLNAEWFHSHQTGSGRNQHLAQRIQSHQAPSCTRNATSHARNLIREIQN